MGTEDPDLNEAPPSHRHCHVCASERSCLKTVLLFMATVHLSVGCAEMMKYSPQLPAWFLPRHLQVTHHTCTHVHTPVPPLLIKKNFSFDLALKSTMLNI